MHVSIFSIISSMIPSSMYPRIQPENSSHIPTRNFVSVVSRNKGKFHWGFAKRMLR